MKHLLIIIFIFSFGQIYGQTVKKNKIDIELDKCMDENPSTQGTLQCISKATADWDKELNENYKKLSKILTKTQKEKLQKSQRQWIKYRDKEVEFSYQIYTDLQGSMWKVTSALNKLSLIQGRASELSSYYLDLTFDK